MLFLLTLILLPLVIFSLPKCDCPPPPSPIVCSSSSNITDKTMMGKFQSGKLKPRKEARIAEDPAVYVDSETDLHVQKRSLLQDSPILDDDSDLTTPTGQMEWSNQKPNKQALTPNELKNNSQLGLSNDARNDSALVMDIKCNNHFLKQLMLENIGDNSSVSKRAINSQAEATFGGNIDVICSKSHFSYVYSSNLYCEAVKGDITCIAFRQSH